jgi:hypothetical protein
MDGPTGQVEIAVGEEPYIYLEVTDDDDLATKRGCRYLIISENDAPTAVANAFVEGTWRSGHNAIVIQSQAQESPGVWDVRIRMSAGAVSAFVRPGVE